MDPRPALADVMPAPRRRGSTRALALATVALAWAAVVYVAFRPGIMSIDALVHYRQGIERQYTNQHPPLVAMLFGLSARWLGTPAGILVLQLAAIAGGFALLAGCARRDRPLLPVLLTAAFLAVPSTWAIGAMLGKDALLVGALLLASWTLRRSARAPPRSRRPGAWRAATLLVLVAATLLRHNAIFATAPLAAAAVLGSPRLRSGRSRALAVAVALAALATALPVVDRLTRARDVWPVGQLFVYDLAGIYVRHPEALPGSTLARDVTAADLSRLYTPFTAGPLEFPHPGEPGVSFHLLAGRRHEIAPEWLRAVRTYPGAYLAHRWAVFRALLGLYRGPVFYPFHEALDPNRWGLHLEPGTLAWRALTAVRDAARDTVLFRGWFWLALSGLAAALAARRARRDPVPLWIALSGVTYTLAYVLISVSAELRYVYWTAVAPFAAAAAALAAPPGGRPTRARRGAVR